jgi:asparagine synthase (glutamine-hydrolysing)
MCGFLGQYNTPNLPESSFRELLALGAHRGPDKTGYWGGERVQLGFNRLAILDLTEAGHQPMRSPNGQFWVVFNGEIYNHLELRKQLPQHNYRGHSDTETITHAVEVWGIRKTIEALDGMFAIAIYAPQTNELTLARDFAGIKPLFYGFDKSQVVFASQYDQIIKHPLFQQKSINPKVLKLYLQQHFLPSPFGLHVNTYQLRPGEIITFKASGELLKYRYWECPDTVEDLITDAKEAQRTFSEAFSSSVKDELVADVGVGAFLSGGVDSPLVCHFAQKHKADLAVFTIGSDSAKHDESERAAKFAQAMHLTQHNWKLSATEMLSYWDEATAALHEPMADFSILPTYLVSKLAKKHVTVSLSGDGGDELFFGYERFWSVAKNLSFQTWPIPLRKGIYKADKMLCGNKNVNSLLTLPNQAKSHESLHSRTTSSWLNRIAPDLNNTPLPEEWDVYAYENTSDLRTLMVRMRKAEFYGMMQKTLRKVDLASMQNSLEVRVPFLQKKTMEAAFRIDPLLSVKNGGRKKVLENVLKSEVPSVPLSGKKMGFTVPLRQWIIDGLHQNFEEDLSRLADKHLFLNRSEISYMIEKHRSGTEDLKWPLFTLYALKCLN